MADWHWPGSLAVRAVDGDTFVAVLQRDLGFHGVATFTQRLRLEGINTPPAKTTEGKRATAVASQLLDRGPLQITTTGPYKYGDEWMAVVVNAEERNVADELVRLGLAQRWDGHGERPGG